MDLSPQGHTGSGRRGQRRHRDPTPKPGLLQPRPLCNPLPVTYRTVLSRQAVQRSSRPVGHGDTSPGLTRSPATRTGRGGAGPAGRGGAVTRSRARASRRALSGLRRCGGRRAAPLRSAPLGSAPLRLFRESGGERGPRPSGPDDHSFVTSCRPAVSGGNEKPGFVIGFSSFPPSLGMRARGPGAASGESGAGRPCEPRPGSARAGGKRRAQALGGGAVAGCLRVLRRRSCCSVSSSSPLRAQGDRSVLNAGSGPGALSFLA